MNKSLERLPRHLKKYVVEQNYERYTAEDQAVWRYIMRQLKDYLSRHAHPCYEEGLKKTGISIDRIPRIEEMNAKLNEFGWGAVPVSGFIPPAAFMEFQSLGILPIASDMRTLEHLLYTPAPDIVHEAAGHAPILIDPDFAAYLKRYANVASQAILSKEDLDLYDAIRELSDVKEDPYSTKEEIQKAETHLNDVNQSLRFISEAGLLSRMNWWTAEYGLIGDLKNPKIFGAGLLSSLGEAQSCLRPEVKKIPLDVHCVDYTYDITEPQPQLFVTPDFPTLNKVLDELGAQLAFSRGGSYGLEEAYKAQTVNTVELESGLQISGLLTEYRSDDEIPLFLRFSGPCQLSFERRQLLKHGPEYHASGYSTPLGPLEGLGKDLYRASNEELQMLGLVRGQKTKLNFASGIQLEGVTKDLTYQDGSLLLICFENARVRWGDQLLFDPSWGLFDMAVGSKIKSVFSGPADREAFVDTEDFVAHRVPSKKFSEQQKALLNFLFEIREAREQKKSSLQDLVQKYLTQFSSHWLAGVELYELLQEEDPSLRSHLESLAKKDAKLRPLIEQGIRLAQEGA